MRPIATGGVAWSIGLTLGYDREPCKNGWTDRDAAWDVDSSGPEEPCVRLGADPNTWMDNFEGEKGPVQDMPTRPAVDRPILKAIRQAAAPVRIECWLACRLGCTRRAWGCTLAPPVLYDWTVHVRPWCGLIMAALYGIGKAIIFLPCGFFYLSSFCLLFSSPNLNRRRLDVCHTSTHGVALVQI